MSSPTLYLCLFYVLFGARAAPSRSVRDSYDRDAAHQKHGTDGVQM